MRVGVDVDGVLYEWEKTARYLLRTQSGYSNAAPLKRESDCWDYIQQVVNPEDWDWLWAEGVGLGLFRYGHIVKGAIEGVRALHAAGHELVVITHRPSCAVRDTLDWLSFIQLPFAGIHILSDGQPKSTVRADILIDDKFSNIQDWALGKAPRRYGLLFNRTWNEEELNHGPHFERVYGWHGVVDTMRRIAC